jgi:murein DD-endopeptidase MepM/ murein hydrolase activator NlpD
LTDSLLQATVTRVFDAGDQALGQPDSQIRLDYKPEDKPVARRPWTQMRWLASAIATPILGAVLLLGYGGKHGTGTADASLIGPAHALQTRPLALPPLPLEELPAAPVEAPTGTTLTLAIKRGDTLDRLFRQNHLDVRQLQMMLAIPQARDGLRLVKPGDELQLRTDDGGIAELTRRLDESHTLIIQRGADGFQAQTKEDALERRVTQARAVIDSSLFNAGKSVGVSDRVIIELASIFAWDIDFVLDIREGDTFTVLYEQVFRDGEYLRDGDIVGAEFTNDGDTFRALRYVDHDGDVGYYTPEGLSMRKAFLRAPVSFTRVSSEFNPHRRHPILNTIRAHQGVDYAAPAGTPVQAAGDGKVIFAGRKGGYGNCVILQHGNDITTLYGHLSRFAAKLHVGQRVHQGELIAYVGMTGLATAPHLHYEYRIAGVHKNPRTVPLPQADPIAPAEKPAFLAQTMPMLNRLALVKATKVAQVDH